METTEIASKQDLIFIGDMPVTALDVYNYVKDSLVVKASELKRKSFELHDKLLTSLPEKWQDWTSEHMQMAIDLDKEIVSHITIVAGKPKVPSELSIIADKADKLHKGVKAAITNVLALSPADHEALRGKIKQWNDEAERKRQEEENRLRLEAQKAEEERRLTEAAQLEAEGLKEEAEAVLEAPQPIVMPTVEKTTPKADMRIYRKVWKYRIINEDLIPDEFWQLDLQLIGSRVRDLKSKCKIPGVQVYEE